ncbi:MAG: hypothetical protein IJ745_05660, partial [Bacteroidales bacterium]|nr:hypothetical protein [Bacteroidales bacterium]
MKRFGLIGRRLGHSYSERYFGEKFAALHLTDHSYRLFELPSLDGLRQWVRQEGLLGFNVTIPYKQEIITHLDALDPEAAAISAVNCVTVENGHRLVGHNTDAPAFRLSLSPSAPSPSLRPSNPDAQSPSPDFLFSIPGSQSTAQALILGTGGAARAVSHALAQMGVDHWMVSRGGGRT